MFRATSPDGLTVLERMPRVDRKWGNGPGGSTEDCLPLKKELTAHRDFMASMQREGEQRTNRWQHNMNARWVDYALDQRTLRDPGTGQVDKVSSQYSYTWVDGSGKTSYQTNDPNAYPNGSLTGTCTWQQVMNGDGTSN